MRRIGNGYKGLKHFSMLVINPAPIIENYRQISYAFNEGVKEVTETVMQDARNENHRESPDEIVDSVVSLDGS